MSDFFAECERCGELCEYELCEHCMDEYKSYEYSEFDEGTYDDLDDFAFADLNGESALKPETSDNIRDLPCPTCGRKNMLTPLDVDLGYQCDICANRTKRGY